MDSQVAQRGNMIYINSKTRIVPCDDNNLKLERVKTVRKKNGETSQEWVFCGWYSRLDQAFSAVLRKELFETAKEQLTLNELYDKIQEAENKILRSVDSALRQKEE